MSTTAAKPQPTQQAPQQAPPRAAEIDPYEDGPAYLRQKGWKCLGNPQGAGWLDPLCPDVPTYRKEKVRAPNWKTGQLEDVLADDGKGNKIITYQTVYDSPAEPMPLQQALMIQLGRDRRALAQAEAERARAAGVRA